MYIDFLSHPPPSDGEILTAAKRVALRQNEQLHHAVMIVMSKTPFKEFFPADVRLQKFFKFSHTLNSIK